MTAARKYTTAAPSPILTGRPDRTHRAVAEPPPLREGQARCPACRNGAHVIKSGALARHRDLFGGNCGNWTADLDVEPLAEMPPVRIEVARKGECRECHRWLPGERSLCGRCYVLQGRS